MRKKIWVAGILYVCFFQTSAFSQNGFPLEQGNLWSYQVNSSGQLSSRNFEVVADTVLPDGNTWWELNTNEPTLGRFVRTDSRFVYFYDELNSTGQPVYKLSALPGESWSINWSVYTTASLITLDTITVFGVETVRHGFLLDGLAVSTLSLLEAFGPESIVHYGDPPGQPDFFQELQGCILSEVLYGNVVSTGEGTESRPGEFRLHQNYPNPFNPATRIAYSLNKSAAIGLSVYDIRGSLVKQLAGGYQTAGNYEVEWDGRNTTGNPVGSGVYLARLSTKNSQQVRKLLLVR